MEYFIGVIVGCFVMTVIFKVRSKKAVHGTFTIGDAEGENSAIGIAFQGQITSETKEIILLKKSRK